MDYKPTFPSVSATVKPSWRSPLLLVQAALACLVLLLSLMPAHGGTALLLPLAPHGGTASTIGWARTQGATILGAGPYRGALMIRIPDARLTFAALAYGALLLPLPEALCSDRTTSRPD